MSLRLADFDAVTFDVYGTLIDWEPSIIAFLTDWAVRHDIPQCGETLLMAFDRARATIQKERPAHQYPEVLRRCLDRVVVDFGGSATPDDRTVFAKQPHFWPAYADSHNALKLLQAGAKIGALSNIDNSSLASSCRKLDFAFDLTVTAERVGAYKPDWPHFHSAIAELTALGIRRERILHVGQRLRADITPANTLGITCAWVNRPGRLLGLSGEGAAEARPDLTVSSMAELASLLAA